MLIYAEPSRIRHVTLFSRGETSGTFQPSAEISAVRPCSLDALPETLPTNQRRALVVAVAMQAYSIGPKD